MDDLTRSQFDFSQDDEMKGKFLTFRVGTGEYGLEITYVTEIIGVLDITPVPNTHKYMMGIINMRGTVVPVIDLSLRFGLGGVEFTERTCIIVINTEEMTIGLIVDEVREVMYIDDEEIQPPPKVSGAARGNSFVRAIGASNGNVKQLLDIDSVCGLKDIEVEA